MQGQARQGKAKGLKKVWACWHEKSSKNTGSIPRLSISCRSFSPNCLASYFPSCCLPLAGDGFWLVNILSRAASVHVEEGWAGVRTPWRGWQKITTWPLSLGAPCPNQNWKGLSCLLSNNDGCVVATSPGCCTALHSILLVLFVIFANSGVHASYGCRANPYKLDLTS